MKDEVKFAIRTLTLRYTTPMLNFAVVSAAGEA